MGFSQLLFHVPRMHLLVCLEYSSSLVVQIQQRTKQRQTQKYYMIQLACHKKPAIQKKDSSSKNGLTEKTENSSPVVHVNK